MSENLKIKSLFRDYEVFFEDDFVADLKIQLGESSFVLIDEKVLDLYRIELLPLISPKRMLVIRALEENKSLNQCIIFARRLIEMNVRKKSTLIAIGGGIIQDITAFLASILFRGIDWQFYPTTLLAQADSCIGSKNSINIDSFKNLVGTFYPPTRILSSTKFLQTLSEDEIKSGIGEMLHFYLFKGKEELEILASCYDQLFQDKKKLHPLIVMSLRIKKSVVEIDEQDRGIRNLFNYGHTFGHAIEAVSNFTVPHGQAVTLGMDIANYISCQINLLSRFEYDWIHQILVKNIPSFSIKEGMIDKYMEALSRDKKNSNDELACILTRGAGKLEKCLLPINDSLKNYILDYFKD